MASTRKKIFHDKNLPAVVKKERRDALLEFAAFCAVQMENGEYQYADNEYRVYERDEDGNMLYFPDGRRKETWNKTVLLKCAGFSTTDEHFKERVGEKPEFQKMVAYHRRRRIDPSFTKDKVDKLWAETTSEIVIQMAEQLKYSPESISFSEKTRALKVLLDGAIAGAKLNKAGRKTLEGIMGDMPLAERRKLMEERHKEEMKKLYKEFDNDMAEEVAITIDGSGDYE